MYVYVYLYVYIYIYIYTYRERERKQKEADISYCDRSYHIPGLRYKIPVFSDPAPGKS